MFRCIWITAQRPQRCLIGAGRTAETEIDPARIQRLERAELLGDYVRRVVRQHDAARADAQGLGPSGDVRDHERRRGGRHARHVVVLGDPQARVTPRLGLAAEFARLVERHASRSALSYPAELEDRKSNYRGRTLRRHARKATCRNPGSLRPRNARRR